MRELKDHAFVAYDEILLCVRISHVNVVVGSHFIMVEQDTIVVEQDTIMVEQDTLHRGTSTLPPVLSKNLLNFSMAQLCDLVVTQTLCLL